MTQKNASNSQRTSRKRSGFARASNLMKTQIRTATESRGFAQSRVLTHWREIVGAAVADIAYPVKISYARDGSGATLTILTTGSQAPMLEMQKLQIKEKVNACYGYNAISHVRITQTAPTGFAEGQIAFEPAPKQEKPIDPSVIEKANDVSHSVTDAGLRDAINALAKNVLSSTKT